MIGRLRKLSYWFGHRIHLVVPMLVPDLVLWEARQFQHSSRLAESLLGQVCGAFLRETLGKKIPRPHGLLHGQPSRQGYVLPGSL